MIVAAGVGGTGGWDALAWATEHAEQTGAALVVLRVSGPSVLVSGRPPAEQVELADPMLARALRTARLRLSEERVSLSVLGGDPGAALVHHAAGAGLLVIGAGRSGSTVRRVIRQAGCPVVVARPAHTDRDSSFAGHVVAGIDGSPAGRAALAFALDYAGRRRLPVCAVHVTAPGDGSAALPAAMALIDAETAPGAAGLRRTVLHGNVTEGLIWAADGAHLLVVGNRHRGPVGRARTGDVPLSLAHRACCPVAVVPVVKP